jgi:serine/threonine protein kinase
MSVKDDDMTLEKLEIDLSEYIYNPDDYVFIKKIGKGGFGEVFLCVQKSTGQLVALKKSLDELTSSTQKYYCREVKILSLMDNPCLISLVGFSVNNPYTIITKYIPNGSLFDYLKKGAKKRLTGTQKTIIAMGIAHGMARFHELGLIHRDLKSLNILIDENMYPVICDFGIARMKEVETGAAMTGQIGTMYWMAPEVHDGGEYNALVDVYSYAMILYELAAEKVPFHGLNIQQFMFAILNKVRPKLPDDTPRGLAALIEQCWADSPDERPNFSRIYAIFKSRIVYFKDTDFNAVDSFIDYVERKPVEDVREEVREEVEDIPRVATVKSPLDITFEKIIDTVCPVSPQTLEEFINEMDNSQCSDLVRKLHDHLKQKDNEIKDSIRFTIYNAIDLVTRRGKDFVNILAIENIPRVIRFDGEISYQCAFAILASFVSHIPQVLETDILTRLLNTQLNKGHAHLVSYIMSKYFEYVVKEVDLITEKNIANFTTDFINMCEDFINAGEILEYLRIVSNLIVESEILREIENDVIQGHLNKIFTADLTKETTHDVYTYAIYCAYKFVIKHSQFNVVGIENHANEPKLRPIVASYLVATVALRNKHLTPLPIKTARLIKICSDHPDSRLLTLMYASTENGANDLVDKKEIWEYKESIPPQWYIRLYLILVSNPNCTDKLLKCKDVYILFAKLAELHIPDISRTLCTIIRKIPGKIMNPKLIMYLEEKKLWGHLIKCLMESDEVEDQKECLSVLCFQATKYVTEQMAKVYPYLGEELTDTSPICLHALTLMCAYMNIPPIKKKFEEKGYIDKVRNLSQTVESQGYIRNILNYYQ